MKPVQFYVGIDISKLDFWVSIFTRPNVLSNPSSRFINDLNGFGELESWFSQNKVQKNNCVICLEATGVYSESLSYYFYSKGYQVVVEQPLKVKRAFSIKGHKSDKIDSRNIAEYAFRYFDKLKLWSPKSDIVEQVKVLLMAREQLVSQNTSFKNTLKVLEKKVVQTPVANKIYKNNVKRLSSQIKKIDDEINKLIEQHPTYKKVGKIINSCPGFSLLFVANFLVVTNGFENEIATNYRKASAFIGICPYQHSSGTSVFRQPKILNYGPKRLRKLLYLASMSVIQHKPKFTNYFNKKVAEGKNAKLVLNNVANKLLKIVCAAIRNQNEFVENHVSIRPNFPQFSA